MRINRARRPSADIIAFPCNQCGGQEKKCDVDIKEFALKKGAKFTMMSKIDVVSCRVCAVEARLARTACPRTVPTASARTHAPLLRRALGVRGPGPQHLTLAWLVHSLHAQSVTQNGANEHEVYSFLKNQPGCSGQILWNFRTKFLISKGGVVTRHDGVNTADLEPEVLKRLEESK